MEAFGTVLETDRGSLPFALVHGEPLVAAAAWAMGEAGVQLVDLVTSWEAIDRDRGAVRAARRAVPADPAGVPGRVRRPRGGDAAVTVGVRPVTDTVKELHDGRVGATHDRTELLQVVSPVVLPAAVVAALDGVPTTDFAALVAELATRFPVETLEAPAEARRVADESDLRVLEALTAPVQKSPLNDG